MCVLCVGGVRGWRVPTDYCWPREKSAFSGPIRTFGARSENNDVYANVGLNFSLRILECGFFSVPVYNLGLTWCIVR